MLHLNQRNHRFFDVKREMLDHTEQKQIKKRRQCVKSYKIFTLHLVDVADEVVLATFQAVGHEQTPKPASKCCDPFPESYPARPLEVSPRSIWLFVVYKFLNGFSWCMRIENVITPRRFQMLSELNVTALPLSSRSHWSAEMTNSPSYPAHIVLHDCLILATFSIQQIIVGKDLLCQYGHLFPRQRNHCIVPSPVITSPLWKKYNKLNLFCESSDFLLSWFSFLPCNN